MSIDLDDLVHHDMSDDCPVCRALDIVSVALIPAAAAWEQANALPQFSLALHGAAQMLGAIMQEGVSRDDIDSALAALLDDIELQIAEDDAMGGPPQGTA